MTESEWLASEDPWALFVYLQNESPCRVLTQGRERWGTRVVGWMQQQFSRTSQVRLDPIRRLYLLACGANQFQWRVTTGESDLPPWLVLEGRFAEGEVTLDELLADDQERRWWWPDPWHLVSNVVRRGLFIHPFEGVGHAYCDLTRDIFGNPFRPVAFSPTWRTDTAIALARQMYESRDFGAMPILADALQDAGCDNDDILSHCRDANQPHVRGCWVLDLLLGKG
jgi:hypothetical protein